MSVHPPKYISSSEGLGVNTMKRLEFLSENIAIGTEVWQELPTPWREGETIIAKCGYRWITKWEAGKPYIITKFYDAQENLVGIYCDASRPVQKIAGGFAFDDLYLDVWQVPGEKPVILDEDELEAAVQAGFIKQSEAISARETAALLRQKLADDPSFTDF